MPRVPRSLLIACVLVVAGYVAVCAWFQVRQRSLMYYPQATGVARTETDFALDRGDAVLRGWALDAGAPAPILYFGGNAEDIGRNRAAFAQWFPRRSVYLLAYRGYGASDGQPSQDALFADALALFDAVQARHPGQPVAVIGRSLGSGVASYLASQRPVARLVLVTPFDSMTAVGRAHFPWLPVGLLLKDRYDATRYLPSHGGPLLVLRAGRDTVVPPANTDHLLAALAQRPQVVMIADADHDSIGSDPRYRASLIGFLR